MDLLAKLFCILFVVWVVAMIVGLVISLMPLILAIVGFCLMMAFLAFIGMLVRSWFRY